MGGVLRVVQDISMYRYSWRSSKAMLGLSCSLFPLASFTPVGLSLLVDLGIPIISCGCRRVLR